ncbi:MAG: hypothetical protein V3R99_01615, partial [Thermoguttaceae bacterium]
MTSWGDVRVPEVAGFLGWNTDAVDVGGSWRFAYDRDLSAEQIAKWADPALADEDWSRLTAPGDDHPRFRNQQQELRVPAVFRRVFSLSDARRRELLDKGQGKCYLYVWSLDRSRQQLAAAINGTHVGEATHSDHSPAWHVFEVGRTLRRGENLLALHLPWCELAYRIYLSPTRPRCYPDLGPEGNARWVDFRDWWQGTVEPRSAPKVPALKNAIPMNEDWAFAPISKTESADAKLDPAVDDADWARIDLGIWNVQGFPDATGGVFRKRVTIPADWSSGRIWAWLVGSGDMLRPPYRVKLYSDGKLRWPSGNSRYSMMSIDLTDQLPPGRHLFAWEMEGTGKFDGVVGDMWLEYVPDPVFTQSAAGQWSTGITLPGQATLTGAKRTFRLDPRAKDYLVQFYIDGKPDRRHPLYGL